MAQWGSHRMKACLICDHLLEWNENGYLTKVRLKVLQNNLSDTVMRSRFVTERWVLQHSVILFLQWQRARIMDGCNVFITTWRFQCITGRVQLLPNMLPEPWFVYKTDACKTPKICDRKRGHYRQSAICINQSQRC